MKKNIFISVILFCFANILAQDEKLNILINPIKSDSISEKYINRANKIIVSNILKNKGFALYLSSIKSEKIEKMSLYSIQVQLSKQNELYNFQGAITDLKSKITKNSIKKKEISESSLFRSIEVGVQLLLNDFLKKIDKEKRKSTMPGKSRKEIFHKKIKTSLNKENNNKPTIDLKNRIMNLKEGVDKQVVKIKNKNNSTKKNNKASLSASTTPNSTSKENNPLKKNEELFLLKYQLENIAKLYYQSQSIETQDTIKTISSFQYFILELNGNISFQFLDTLAFNYGALISKVISGHSELDIPARNELKLGLGVHLFGRILRINFDYTKESTSFTNVPSFGEGLKVALVSVGWTNISVTFIPTILKLKHRLNLSIAHSKNAQVDSSYRSDTLQASTQAFEYAINIYKKYYIELGYSKLSMVSQQLDLSETRYSIGLNYEI